MRPDGPPLYPPLDLDLVAYRSEITTVPTAVLLTQQEYWGWEEADLGDDEAAAPTLAFVRFKRDEVGRELERRSRLADRPAAPQVSWSPVSDPAAWQTIKDRLDLKGVIEQLGAVRGFQRAGDRTVCSCPLGIHPDTTPSFTVYPDQHFHCFGCGIGGSVIDFYMIVRQVSFADAVTDLAALAQLDAPTRSRVVITRAGKEAHG